MDICHLKRNKDIFQAILPLDITSNKKAMQEGSLVVRYDCCPVYDAIELRMCYKCCGFSQFTKNCNNNIKCAKCSRDHNIKFCNTYF